MLPTEGVRQKGCGDQNDITWTFFITSYGFELFCMLKGDWTKSKYFVSFKRLKVTI